jgi:AraC-like DNA-binding protein
MYGYSYMHIYSTRTRMHSGTGSFTSCAGPAGVSDQTEFLISRSHAPSARARRVFNVVLDSGHFRAGRSYRVERRRVLGHELLYCVNGSGYVASNRGRFRVEPCHLAWLSGFSAQWADENTPTSSSSRDFKRHTGSCPSEYRRERSSTANGKSVSYTFAQGS